MKNKTILPITFGCKLNQKDTEEWMYWFSEYGVQEQKVDPDIVLINTCVVTDHAEKEAIIAIKKWKATYPKACFIVTGCGVRKKNNMFTKMPEIQYCFPRFTIESQQKLYDLIGTKEKIQGKKYVALKTRSFIKIQEGCDNYCGYCIVPYVRGSSVNRSMDEIVLDVQQKEKEGVQEVVLTGINIGSYGAPTTTSPEKSLLPILLREILGKTNMPRIRLSSLGPEYISDELIHLIKENSRICNFVHLSVQSGSNEILRAMNRHYQREDMIKIVQKMKQAIPHISFIADMIVGYPGETEQAYRESFTFAEAAGLSKIHVFPFSPREGTAAAKMDNQISLTIKQERAKKLRDLSSHLQQQFAQTLIGTTMSVLFEKKRKNPYSGWSTNYMEVWGDSTDNVQTTIRDVLILDAQNGRLVGKII